MMGGKILISTVSRHKSTGIRKIFEPLGVKLIDFPMIEIVAAPQSAALQNIIGQIETFHWIIFTSANGVIHFLRLMRKSYKAKKIPPAVKIAVVGGKTALELKNSGHQVDFTGSGTAEDLINELIEKESLDNCKILLPLGNLAPDTLQDRLSTRAQVTRINVYYTRKPTVVNREPIERIETDSYDLILFTSPSGVSNFAEVLGPAVMTPELRIASIGEITTRAVESYGATCLITAKKPTYEGLALEILNYYKLNE